MTADYITLRDGRKVRLEWDLNALSEFNRITGKELSDLAGADVATLRCALWCAVCEGEAYDGRTFELDELALGRLVSMMDLKEFIVIISRQIIEESKKKKGQKGIVPTVHVRS